MELKEFARIMNVSDWIALLSFAVSSFALGWSAITGKKLKKQEIKLNEFQLEKIKEESISKKRALICAVVESLNSRYKVIVSNQGSATATNIRFESSAIDDDDSGLIFLIDDERFPYPMLNQGECFTLYVTPTEERTVSNPMITFIWDDEYQKDNKRKQALDFG